MAVQIPAWFDWNAYLNNKLAEVGSGTMDSLVSAMDKAGFKGPEGYYMHFLQFGHKEDVSPSAGFDATQYYTFKAAEVYRGGDVSKVNSADISTVKQAIADAGMDAWTHYQKFGTAEMINASNSFDTAAYLQAKAVAMGGTWTAATVADAIQKAGMNAYEHYKMYAGKGINEVASNINVTVDPSKQTNVAGQTFTLTVNPDVATANVFDAPRGWTPGGTDQMNTLNDDDVLTGTGDKPTLNFTYVDDNDLGANPSITPTLKGIETINVAVVGTQGKTLDLQDSTGLKAVDVSRINSNTTFSLQNTAEKLDTLSITNSQAQATVNANFLNSALSGTADSADVTLNNVNLAALLIEGGGTAAGVVTDGYETLNVSSNGSANVVGLLTAEDLQTLNISGDQTLTLTAQTVVGGEAYAYAAGLANVAGSLENINASALTAGLTLALGAEANAFKDGTSGVPVTFNLVGTAQDDLVVVTAPITNANATLDGGEGRDTLRVNANVSNGTYTGFEVLDVRASAIVDAARFTGLEEILMRNEGTGTITLNNLTADQYANLKAQHSITTQNGLASNVFAANLATNTANDSVAITFADKLDTEVRGVNTDVRFNFQLNAAQAENVTLNDNDTESNTIQLGNVAAHTGTVSLTGGAAGKFLNLDATGNLFGYDTSGAATGDRAFVSDIAAGAAERLVASTIDAAGYAGNVVVRVSEADNATGAQTITMGAGNDTVIFDDLNDNTAGLTISDVVDGGVGNDTLAIDGDGVRINISASEWTNVSNFETIRLVGNGMGADNGRGAVNAYNLTLTNDLIAANGSAVTGGRSIAIVNDNGGLGASANAGVTIDARTLNAQSSFSYDGQETNAAEGTAMTADRFIMADANINGLAVIDGGANGIAGLANADVLEVRNAAVVTTGDLAGISNVSNIEFTNDTAAVQTSRLVLNDSVVDNLVNANNAASAAATETLTITAVDNAVLANATTQLDIDASAMTNANLLLSITGGGGADVIVAGAGNDIITGGAGADTLTGGAGADTFVYAAGATGITLATADTITDFATAVDTLKVGFAGATGAAIADGSGFAVVGGDAGFGAFVTAANAVFTAGVGANDDVYAAWDVAGTGNAYVAVDVNDSASLDAGDYVIVLSGIDAAAKIALGDFIV